jgi:sugar lactone lactonase YvrE
MDFNRPLSRFACTVALFLASASLLACGGGSKITVANPTLAIADTGNNRILIYNTSVDQIGTPTVVLGQPDFFSGDANRGTGTPAANTFNIPASVAKDAAGDLFVADTGNSRVLIFRPPFATGMKASVVIGQQGFTTNNVADNASSMGGPYSLAVDSKGNLWVSDDTNDRVLEYTPPFSNGMAATLAIGQTSTDAATVCYENPPTANRVCDPEGMAFDEKGDLWLTDSRYNRILEYTPPFSTGMAASLELGQPASAPFTSGTAIITSPGIPSATSLAAPVTVTFDASGNLWLADYGFNRVLEYAPPFANGMAATSVLGQVDFTHGDANRSSNSPAADTLSGPWGLAFDSSGNLHVSDRGNSRLLVFASPLTNGTVATSVVGQTNFTAGSENQGTGSPTANSLAWPFSLSTF